ncbi:MAG: glycosyltransferase [Patescibacteria group bacterium]|jgi:glycosyltransferase involved in cell wall biosynthesis
MLKKPLVTVVMPIYNGEVHLETAIKSILNQTYPDFELLILDDASTDSSLKIIKSFNDPRIRLIQNEANAGLNKTLNIGLAAAHSVYIARMDQDDISHPERLKKQIAYLEQNPEIGVCGTAVEFLAKTGKKTNLIFPTGNNLIKWAFCFYNPIAHPTVMMRKKIVEQVNGYSTLEHTHYTEDYDLWYRLLPITKFHNLEEPLLTLRKHESNMTVKNLEKNLQNAGTVNKNFLEYFLNHKIQWDLMNKLNTKNEIYFNHVISTIIELVKNFKIIQNLSREEQKFITFDAARRLVNLFLINLKNKSSWKFLKTALNIDPLLPIHYLLNFFKSANSNAYRKE